MKCQREEAVLAEQAARQTGDCGRGFPRRPALETGAMGVGRGPKGTQCGGFGHKDARLGS